MAASETVTQLSLEERLAQFVQANRPVQTRVRTDESFDPRIVTRNGNVYSWCGILFRFVPSNVIGKASMGTSVNPAVLQEILPGAVYDADNVRSLNVRGACPRGLGMVYQRCNVTVIGADSVAGMLTRFYRIVQALQSRGYPARLTDAHVFNMAATVRPIGGILKLDLQRFADRPVHAPYATYDPRSIDSLRYTIPSDTSNRVTANIFAKGRAVVLGGHGDILEAIVRFVISLIGTEYLLQSRENEDARAAAQACAATQSLMHRAFGPMTEDYGSPTDDYYRDDSDDDDLADLVLKSSGLGWATQTHETPDDAELGSQSATGRRGATASLTGVKRARVVSDGSRQLGQADDADDEDDDGAATAGYRVATAFHKGTDDIDQTCQVELDDGDADDSHNGASDMDMESGSA